MAVTVFRSRLGLSQGRIHPQGVAPLDGEWVMVLGEDREGRFATLARGDWIGIRQTVQLTGVQVIRVPMATFRVPADAGGAGLAWELAGYVDSTEVVRMRGWPGRRELSDFAIDVHDWFGMHTIQITLELVLA